MGQVYGERWEGVQGDLGQGGQSRVLTVVDLRAQEAGIYALKRILNPKRVNRFRNEVEAIKSLSHINVIPLLDYSAFDADDFTVGSKRYIVMPIAEGGDLGKVAANFLGDLGRVLEVATQIASALDAAHGAKIIHRDVKPENILLSGKGDHVWLCDFGICLIDDGRPRDTSEGEVVGPVTFMAPELEGGGNLDVTPAADVYSLGKIIYFLFTGGVRLPRESLGDDRYASPLAASGLEGLRLLLTQMICPLERRLKTMDVVLTRLNQLRAPATSAALSEAGFAARDRAASKLTNDERLREAKREEEQRSILVSQAASALLTAFIADQAAAGAKALHVEGAFKAWTNVSTQASKVRLGNRTMIMLETHEVLYQNATSAHARVWALQFQVHQSNNGQSQASLNVLMRLELREADQKRVANCSAYLKLERAGRNHVNFQVTDTAPTCLDIKIEHVADAEAEVRSFVRNAVSALPDLASRGSMQFTIMQLSSKSRRR